MMYKRIERDFKEIIDFFNGYDNYDSWNYCMLKKDYVKLLKEQAK